MTALDFTKKYLADARDCENKTGVHHLVTLGQAALESGWGEKAPCNEFFGIKDSDGINGNEQLLPTTEYSRYPHLSASQVGLATIDRIEWNEASHMFIYHGKAYFRKYDTPAEAFIDHAKLFFRYNQKHMQPYAEALPHLKDAYQFVDIIAPIYASGPGYATIVQSIMHSLEKLIETYKL